MYTYFEKYYAERTPSSNTFVSFLRGIYFMRNEECRLRTNRLKNNSFGEQAKN